jgi:GAF domain-containing protein
MPLDKKSNISSRAILEKKLIHVSDAAREKRINREFLERFAINEFAAVPLMAKNEVVGLVIVDNPLTRKSITKSDLRFLQLLLNQAGIGVRALAPKRSLEEFFLAITQSAGDAAGVPDSRAKVTR